MEKTNAKSPPINGGITCSECRFVLVRVTEDLKKVGTCLRYPPQVIGGVALNPMGAPAIVSQSASPSIGDPEQHYCGEFKQKSGTVQ